MLAAEGIPTAAGVSGDAGGSISSALPWVVAIFVVFVAAGLIVLWINLRLGKKSGSPEVKLTKQLVTAGMAIVVVAVAIAAAPMDEQTKEALLKLIGLALTVVVAFSSTTFVSNAMAGLMLRSLKNFKVGDWLRVEKQLGRVTERGLFHIEIQTEDRDLTTLPNLYLVQNPVTVVHATGTIVSATLSLGYDVPHGVAEKLLAQGAEDAGLTEPFVQVTALGDHSVTYRVAGFLPEVKQLLSARSRLRVCSLDALHAGGVEILSPTYMNQRPIDVSPVIPARQIKREAEKPAAEPESVIFDKAEEAERLDRLRKERDEAATAVKELEGRKKGGEEVEEDLERTRGRAEALEEEIKACEEAKREEG